MQQRYQHLWLSKSLSLRLPGTRGLYYCVLDVFLILVFLNIHHQPEVGFWARGSLVWPLCKSQTERQIKSKADFKGLCQCLKSLSTRKKQAEWSTQCYLSCFELPYDWNPRGGNKERDQCPGVKLAGLVRDCSHQHKNIHSLVVMETVFGRKVGADRWCVLGPFADNPGFAVKANLREEKD